MAITCENLTVYSGNSAGRDVNFLFYGEDSQGSYETSGKVQRLVGRQAAITLPEALPDNSFYLMWPMNANGYGSPVAINKTDAWWIGFSSVHVGDEFAVYGRNLALGGGDSYLYIEGYGWITSKEANPYKAKYDVPSNLAPGTYTVYAHNGHGREYGWSEALSLEVKSAKVWNSKVYNVANYGANGNDSSADDAAISAASSAAANDPGSTVYFPAGTYYLSGYLKFYSNVKYVGAGMGSTIIKPSSSGRSSSLLAAAIGNEFMVQDMTFRLNDQASNGRPFYLGWKNNITFENVEVNAEDASSVMHSVINLNDGYNYLFKGCRFVIANDLYVGNAKQTRFENCTFLGIRDCNQLVAVKGATELDVSDCYATNLDESDITSGDGWCKGRWITGTGPSTDMYFGHNTTANLMPRLDPNKSRWDSSQPDQNSGEQIMFEGLSTRYRGSPLSVTDTTVKFAPFTISNNPQYLVIANGTGYGQSRRILSIDAGSGTITVDTPWRVKPDTSSVVYVGNYLCNVVTYGNYLDGRPRAAEEPANTQDHTASAGYQSYGGALNIVVDGNTFNELGSGIANYSVGDNDFSDVADTLTPNFFNEFKNNTMNYCYAGILQQLYAANKVHGLPLVGYDPTIVGNVIRNNDIGNCLGSAVSYWSHYDGDLIVHNVHDKNRIYDSAKSVTENQGIRHSVWIQNQLQGSSSSGIELATGHLPVLQGNTWVGFDSSYGGNLPGEVLEVPNRVVSVNSSNVTDITVLNSGTAPMNWSANVDSDWLSVETGSGTVSGENAEGAVELQINQAAVQSGTVEPAIVSISSGDQVKEVTVVYDDALVIGPTPPVDPPTAVLSHIEVSGPFYMDEQTSAQMFCTAFYSDGTSEQVDADWSEDSDSATISADGLLQAGNVLADLDVTVTATFNGKSDSHTATIRFIAPTLDRLEISGSTQMDEGTSSPFSCTAYYTDGSSAAVTPTWSEDSSYASISSGGLLTAADVTADQVVTITALFEGVS
ncbi:glycosyl hydrolase family 28-related protein, partial [Pontiella sp.]|uniref:glycosyl hydrolase family 28-related protein n=1 Tax=Pontiella sp. TaxID=2837462 RepID=UPI0035615E8D